jgi:putative nucleotidyltransferase with HDIG domain
MDELRAGVRASLPEIDEIQDESLREKVVEAWAYALSQSEFTTIDEIRASGGPNTPKLKAGTQAHHLRGVARMAIALADALEAVHGDIGVNRDLLWACGLCHDVGKPYEFSPRNQARWQNDVAAAGYPAIRHSVYGVHVCLTVGAAWRICWCTTPIMRIGMFWGGRGNWRISGVWIQWRDGVRPAGWHVVTIWMESYLKLLLRRHLARSRDTVHNRQGRR